MKYSIDYQNRQLPIAEDEIPKIVDAMQNKAIVVLKCGILNGAFISGITKDLHAEFGYNYGYKFKGEDNLTRASFVTDLPEKIKELRGEVIKKLTK